jgi:hypothetical protein
MIYCIGKTVKEKHRQINQIFTQKILPEGENRKIIDYRLLIIVPAFAGMTILLG